MYYRFLISFAQEVCELCLVYVHRYFTNLIWRREISESLVIEEQQFDNILPIGEEET